MWVQDSVAGSVALLAVALSLCLSSSQPQFQNFESAGDQGRGRGAIPQQQQARQSSSLRGLPQGDRSREDQRGGLPQGDRSREDRRETTTQVAVPILKQINDHNEDGSYTYGYEAADGTFKLETRFKDGSVQGKYGYVDVNGDVKIIEYGANAMGFQPQGDLPEGIIIPPPVEGNCTDCNYDYDYVDEVRSGQFIEESSNLVVQNRARGNIPQPQAPVVTNQFRGQQLNQPITPAPLPRRGGQPTQQQSPQRQQSFPAFTARQPSAPAPVRQAAAPVRQPPPVPSRQPLAAAPTGRQPLAAAPSGRQPIGVPRQAVPSRQPAPQRAAPTQPEFRPTRPALPPTIAPVRTLPDPVPASSSSSMGEASAFSNFPARDSPSRPRSRPSGEQSSRFQAVAATPEPVLPTEPESQKFNPSRGRQRGPTRNQSAAPTRIQPQQQAAFQPQQQAAFQPQQQSAFQPQQQAAFQPQQQAAFQPQKQAVFQPQQQAVFQSGSIRPAFEDVGTRGSSQSFNSFPAVGAPAPLTSRPALTFQEPQPVSAVPANLPPSALEIVDFNQLVQEFQGSLRPQPANRFQNNVFQNPPNTQTRFSTDNFPVRF